MVVDSEHVLCTLNQYTMTVDEYISQSTVIYVLRGYRDGYKIGCTTQLLSRYAASVCRRDIVHLIPVPASMNMYEAERLVQNRFGHCRISGEAYDLTEDDLLEIGKIDLHGN